MRKRRKTYGCLSRREYEQALRHEALRSARVARRHMEFEIVERAVLLGLIVLFAVATVVSASAGLVVPASVAAALGVVTRVRARRYRGASQLPHEPAADRDAR